MLDVIAPLDTEGDTAEGIAAKEAACYACTPLVSCALMLKLRPLLSVSLAMRALEEHCSPLPIQPRKPYELPLLLSD